ncbi:hypothetical protein AVEN_131859-1 [Araneus ventricosus]|uniref:Uncharacterized protein n=1 Tax=Araneus ventricosus TaxID=182803 RepID=A0A4Y2PP54_ARAVE|nr:hypothetical protein AVEN_131859-1 [Araneus ventricosus]
MLHIEMSPDELKQHFLYVTSLREKKALVDSLSKKLKDLGKDNEPPDHIEIKNVMYEQLQAVDYQRAMKLQKKLLTLSDSSRQNSSARSTRSPCQFQASADESRLFETCHMTEKKRDAALQSDISKMQIKVLLLELKNQYDSLFSEGAWILKTWSKCLAMASEKRQNILLIRTILRKIQSPPPQ